MKKQNIKKIFLILSCAALFSFIECTDTKKNQSELNFWAMGVEGEKVAALVPEFEKQNPGVKVHVQQVPWTAAHEKLITAYASETLPDLFQLGNTWIPEFDALNSIEPLNKFISRSTSISDTMFFKGIWETNILDTSVLGIPWYVDTRVFFYRSDILEKAGFPEFPKTWSELYTAAKKIKQLPGFENKYAFLIPTNEWVPFIIFGMQNGSTLLKNNNTTADFSGKEFLDAFKYLTRYYHEGLSPTNMQQVLNIYQAFAEGYFSMFISGPWNVSEMKNRLPAELQGRWATSPLPSPDSTYPGSSIPGGASLVINKNSEQKELAWKWIEYLSQTETQLIFYKSVASLPSLKKVWENEILKNDNVMKAFYLQLNNTKLTPMIPEWEQIVSSKIQQYAEMVALNKISEVDAMKAMDKDTDKILEKRRWMLENK